MPRQNTPPSDYPQAVLQQIELLARNIVIARKRRGETQSQWARKLGVSLPTMARIERGDPSVAMASYVMCLWLVNPAMGLADLIAPQRDHAALERELSRVSGPRKAARPRSIPQGDPVLAWRVAEPGAASEPARPTRPRTARLARNPRNANTAGLAALIAASPTEPPA